jgi:Fe-S-cluster-containing dehydrogenase component
MNTARGSHRTIALHRVESDGEGNDEGLTRRGALQLMAASVALASGACTREPVDRIYPYVDMPEAGRGGLPAYYASAFVREGHAVGVLIGTREGRPIKIEGNPLHPSSLGATDVFAQASVLELWDPDRSQSVWQRLPALATDGIAAPVEASNAAAVAGRAQAPQAAPSTWAAFNAAWRLRTPVLDSTRGRGLAVLTPHFTSPTLGACLQDLLKRFPEARWHRYSPLTPTAARAGATLAFGRECEWLLHFDRARFVLTLDADPFSEGPGRLRHAHDWARQRAGVGADESARTANLPRSLAIESRPGLFGARADERVAMAPAAIERLIDDVAAGLGIGAPVAALPPVRSGDTDPVQARGVQLAAALKAAGRGSLVIAGRSLSPRAHAQVAMINQAVGALGVTLEAIEPLDRVADLEPRDLAELVDAMTRGRVDTLLILGANPAYDAPGSLDFAGALGRVAFSAHLGLYRDETARLATWHLPASHDYECWGDARGHDGTACILQPAILPLYDTRSSLEWLATLAGKDAADGHSQVRATWRDRHQGVTDFDTWWRQTLRAGVVDGSRASALSLAAARAVPAAIVAARSMPADALVAVHVADASADAGRFANNGWLQELPRPFSALTWGNAAHLGPRTAAQLHVVSGDVVRISAGGRAVEAPIWVLAEHAEGVITLPLGYGRRAAGRVGNGVGFDANPLRRLDDGPVAVDVARTGRVYRFAVTQHRLDQQGRELARSVVAAAALPATAAPPSLYSPMATPEHAWAMTIDLDACIGCNACTIACQAENNIPVVGAEQVARGREMHWIRVDRYRDDRPDSGSVFQPVPCMHCEDAPCELVCPVGATVHDSEGLNVQVYNRCVGTRFCSNNCPYKVRRFNFLKYEDDHTETLKAMRNPEVTVRQRGVMEKCTYCVQRLSGARIGAEKAGVPLGDGDVLTACQAVCPTRAIHFGDLRDASSDVVRAKSSPRHYAMLDELNTKPRTTYLARVVPATRGAPGGNKGTT